MAPYTLRSAILFLALVAAFAVTPVAPEAGNILFLVAASAGVFCLRLADAHTFRRPVVWMPLAGLAIMAATYGLNSRSITTVLIGISFFSPFLTIAPLLSLARHRPAPDPIMIAILSICGASGAAVVAIGEVMSTGTLRAGLSVANPIHFADVALAAGFMSTIGTVYATGTWRYLFLLGPFFAAAAVLLSGTRGAAVALVLMGALAILQAVALRRVPLRVLVTSLLLVALALGVAIAAGIGQTSGVQRVLADIRAVIDVGLPADPATEIRLQMYNGGIKAFLDSPWIGHGPLAYVEAASSRADPTFGTAPHLHNDILNFAVSAGIPGLLAYLLFLFAPLTEALCASQSARRVDLAIVITSLTVGYFVMGLTNAMFGVLMVTVFFCAIAVATGLLAQVRETTRHSG